MAERDVETAEEAAEFGNGLFYRLPSRVWLADGSEHAIGPDVLPRLDKPGD